MVANAQETGAPQVNKPSILIGEDERNWQRMLSGALKEGFEVDLARDVPEALTRLAQKRYDLAIVDLRLPGSIAQSSFEGQTLLDALKERGVFSIVVSGYVTPALSRKLLDDYGPYGLYAIVDKLRFADAEVDYLHTEFLTLLRDALHDADNARLADSLAEDFGSR